jgi:hypothetical protein
MTTCPNCGYRNADAAAVCILCNQVLPPPASPGAPPPIPIRPVQAPQQNSRNQGLQYFLGLGLGLIPVIVFLVGIGFGFTSTATSALSGALLVAGLAMYAGSIVVMIVCLFFQRVRFLGYGLLTSVLISPVFGVVGCVVIYSSHPPAI